LADLSLTDENTKFTVNVSDNCMC